MKNKGIYYDINRKSFYIRFILILFVLFFVNFFFSQVFLTSIEKHITDLSSDWELYKKIDDETVPITEQVKSDEIDVDEVICYSTVLSEVENMDTILIKSTHQYIRVYLDGLKLFENTAEITDNDPGIGLHFVQLPQAYGQKTLKIEVRSPYRICTHISSPVYLGSAATLFVYTLSRAFPILFYFIICLLTGFFLIAYTLYSRFTGVARTDKLYLGLFSILWGMYCVSWDNIACLFLPPTAISWISVILHITYMLPFFNYFRLHFTVCHRFTFMLQFFFYCLAGTMCLLLCLSVIDIPYAVLTFNYILVAVFLPMIVIALYEFKRGNPLIRFLTPAISLIIAGVIATIMEQFNILNGMSFYLASIFIFICFNWFYQIRKLYLQRMNEKEYLKMLTLKNNLILNRYKEMEENIKKMREIRHEIKHHLAAIQILCSYENVDRISDYVSAISSETFLKQDITYSKHPIVDSILSNYATQARKLDLQFTHEISLPESLSIPDADLLILLLNMLDNAFEASARASEKWVHFQMNLKGSFLIISCKNSYCGILKKQKGKIITHKKDKEIHGQGIQIMMSIAEKYQSTLVIHYDSQQFILKTALQAE